MQGVEHKNAEEVIARRQPSRNRRASISVALLPASARAPPNTGEDDNDAEDSKKGDVFSDNGSSAANDSSCRDVEAGMSNRSLFQAREGKTRVVPRSKSTIVDVARGRTSISEFLDSRASLGFRERSQQNNIEKMEKVHCLYVASVNDDGVLSHSCFA